MKGYCVNCTYLQKLNFPVDARYRGCTRVENEKVTDPVTGETGYRTGIQYPFTGQVNGQGQCDEFEEKS